MRHAARNARYATYLGCIAFHFLTVFGFVGCAGKVDPILLESSLNDTQKAISQARRLGAEEYATETFNKATRLFEGAQQAPAGQQWNSEHRVGVLGGDGHLILRVHKARQRIAQDRIDEADARQH